MKKRLLTMLIAMCLLVAGVARAETDAEASFHYLHDPRENPSAMADIVEDASAVYGFRPSAEGSLKHYADMDWDDPELVEAGRQDRLAYHESIEEMYKLLVDMKAEGASTEEIARAVSTKRNEIRLASYEDDPEGLEAVKARNLEQYGHEEGPLPEESLEKYGTWQKVLEKAFSTNSGMDACLGLYDDYYELYIAAGQIPPETDEVELTRSLDSDNGLYEAAFTLWVPDAPALNALIDYVEDVTNPDSENFIPEADRIATFDMDGTLMGELYPTYLEYYMLAWHILKDPDYQPDAETLEVGRLLRDCALDNSFPEDMAMRHALAAAKAYSGMTLNEFSDFVTKILVREVDGFEGMTYGECFYLPMVEVVEYLQDNGFTCYICSGSDRFICRVFIEGMLEIPYNNVIGMDVRLEATEQGDEAALDHTFSIGEDVIRTDELLIKNLKTNKVLQIAQEIGQRPVLSFGNSSGDTSMHNYVISNNPYKSAAFMLVADDEVRDYGNAEKGAALAEKWAAAGYNVISMRDDWKTIYGEDVHKTGEFHWLEELSEDREPSDK